MGGTKCVCVLGSGPADIRAEVRIETRGPTETLREIRQVLAGWRSEHEFRALGIASFGPADLDARSAVNSSTAFQRAVDKVGRSLSLEASHGRTRDKRNVGHVFVVGS